MKYPRFDCPEHGSQQVTGISGDLKSVSLACGAVLTGTPDDVKVTHPEEVQS